MSEVKVNKITPKTNCGTTTLGDSGDTFNIPAGVTISNSGTATGFGATGAVSWDTATIKTTGFTATAGVGYFCNTTGGAFQVDLPAGTAGDVVGVCDYAQTFDTYALTLAANGAEKINGSGSSPAIDTKGQSVTLVYVDAARGWIVTDDGLASSAETSFVSATGGCITTCGNYKIHTFTSPGTFNVTQLAESTPQNNVDYLIVAGGGGSGYAQACYQSGGGGGAGGYRESPGTATGCYTVSPLGAAPAAAVPVSVQGYPIVVGGGGAGAPTGPSTTGTPGVDSTALGLTSTGGGGGAGWPGRDGDAGGSGGGGGTTNCLPNPGQAGNGNSPPVNPPQGQPGGTGVAAPFASGCHGAGGGGGAGGAATNGSPSAGGNGGAGVGTAIHPNSPSPVGTPGPSPSLRYFAGGGGGGHYNPGAGGTATSGGGAGGSDAQGTAGSCNTGGGAGGTSIAVNPAPVAGVNGGSGIVIIRYRYQ